MLKVLSRLALLTVVLGVTACAVIQPKTDEERVVALSEQRQAALLEHDFKKAYQYVSPGYRQLNNLESFTSDNIGVYSWESSEVLGATCEDEICKVNVKVIFDMGLLKDARGPKPEKFLVPRINKETWVKLDNKWWFSKSQ
jgi:hypothetical protein